MFVAIGLFGLITGVRHLKGTGVVENRFERQIVKLNLGRKGLGYNRVIMGGATLVAGLLLIYWSITSVG